MGLGVVEVGPSVRIARIASSRRTCAPRPGVGWRQSEHVHARIRDSIGGVFAADEHRLAAPAPGSAAPRRALDRLRQHGVRRRRAGQPSGARPDSAFDVCHVGVVLRALLFVHGVMAIGMVFAARDVRRLARRSPPPARASRCRRVLLWLLVACALEAAAGALRRCRRQWAIASRSARSPRCGCARCSSPPAARRAGAAAAALLGVGPGARRRGDRRGACSSGCACAPRRTLPAETDGAPGRAAVAHPAALPVQHAQHRARAGAPRPGQGRGRARGPGRAVPRRHRRAAPSRSRWPRRSSWRSATSTSSRSASASRLHVDLGARPAGRVARACRRCCCSRWSRTRCATASSRRAEGGVIRVRTQGQARPRGAVDRQQRAQGPSRPGQRHGAEERPRAAAPDARRRRAVRDAPGRGCLPSPDRGAAMTRMTGLRRCTALPTRPLRVLVVDDEELARLRLRAWSPNAASRAPSSSARPRTPRRRWSGWRRAAATCCCSTSRCRAATARSSPPSCARARRRRRSSSSPRMPEHALQAFDLEAVDYLTKPVKRERLQAALRRVAQRLGAPRDAGRPPPGRTRRAR